MRAQGEAAGAWRLIALSRGDAGWRASVTERAITPSGDVAPLAPFVLALPGPAPCEARAGA
jgi:hypothetical protein